MLKHLQQICRYTAGGAVGSCWQVLEVLWSSHCPVWGAKAADKQLKRNSCTSQNTLPEQRRTRLNYLFFLFRRMRQNFDRKEEFMKAAFCSCSQTISAARTSCCEFSLNAACCCYQEGKKQLVHILELVDKTLKCSSRERPSAEVHETKLFVRCDFMQFVPEQPFLRQVLPSLQVEDPTGQHAVSVTTRLQSIGPLLDQVQFGLHWLVTCHLPATMQLTYQKLPAQLRRSSGVKKLAVILLAAYAVKRLSPHVWRRIHVWYTHTHTHTHTHAYCR